MKRDLSDSEQQASAKKLEQEKPKQTEESAEIASEKHEPLESANENESNQEGPPKETKDEVVASPEAGKESNKDQEADKEPSGVSSPTLKSGNPLLSGAFASSFGGKASAFSSSFGSSFGGSSGFSGFSSSMQPKENPWSEKIKDEKEEEEEKEKTPEPPKTDQYAVVALEKQETKTGEEEESTVFQARAKLYVMNLKDTASGWKERGVGALHLNFSEHTSKYRVLMRADALHKVILNTSLVSHTELHKGFQSSAQSAKFVRLSGAEADGSLYQYALRLQTAELADELFEHLQNAKI